MTGGIYHASVPVAASPALDGHLVLLEGTAFLISLATFVKNLFFFGEHFVFRMVWPSVKVNAHRSLANRLGAALAQLEQELESRKV